MTSETIHRQPLVRARRRVVEDDRTYPYDTLIEALEHHALETPDRVAFNFEDGTLTYGELLADARRIAKNLFVRGVDRGGRCALVLDSGPELIRYIVAIQMLGAAPVVVNPELPAPATIRRLRDVRAELAVASERLLPALNQENGRVHSRIRVRTPGEILNETQSLRVSDVIPSRDDFAVLVLSPGTDGGTHGVTFKQRQIIAWCNATADHLEVSTADTIAAQFPLFDGKALAWFVFLPLVVGCRVIHRQLPERAPERWLRAVAEHEPTLMICNDSFLKILAGARFWERIEIDSLRMVVSYGEPSRATTMRDFETRFGLEDVVRPAYGLVETVGAVAIGDGGDIEADRNGIIDSGKAIPGIAVRVARPDGTDRTVGEIGEIVVGGEMLFESYFDQPALTGDKQVDGEFHTGDLGYFDSDGRLFVLGRDHEIIRLAHRSLLPRQVEEAAEDVQNVEALAAIGRPADELEQDGSESLVVVAEVSHKAGEARDQMRQISDDISAAVKSAMRLPPDEILLVKPGVLPRTVDGRMAYARLRDMVVGGRLAREGAILHGGNVFISPLKR
ncbi:MAG: acyl--CoA ligase [Alphaproteobacteria bacterium]|nr:acyl--CoA ligase [Alphaproteobacteria bacterium]